jgi:pilus assembly protein CpaB
MKKLSPRSSRFYLIVCVVSAILAALILFAYLRNLRSRIAESGSLVQLVVAARDLGEGEVLDPSSLSLIDFPDVYLFPGTFSDPLALAGSTLRHPVKAGEPLLESALLPLSGGGLARASLDKGFRAYPLPSNSVSLPSGELYGGSRVDILAVMEDKAYPLLENVEVICVYGRLTAQPADSGSFATTVDYAGECIILQVTAEEACRLASAQEAGKVELLLRPDD